MKNASLILVAVVLAQVPASAQGLPDDPTPVPQQSSSTSQPVPPLAPMRDAFWLSVQQIANGEAVLVTSTYGPPLRCRFAGATNDFLFCDPPGSPEGTGYRFERATVLDVKVVKPPRNWHPGLLSAMIGGGLVVGIAATQYTDAGHAAQAGLIGALVSGAIAAPFAFLPPPPQRSAVGFGVVFRPHGFERRTRLFPSVHH